MRKVLIVLVALCFLVMSSNLFAQGRTAKGQIELGGSAGFAFSSASYDGEDSHNETQISLYPRIGVFVADKLELELQTMLKSYTLDPEGGRSSTTTHFGGILSTSYNFEGGSSAIPFIFIGVGFQTNSITDVEDLETSLIFPEVGVGLKSFSNGKWAVRTEIFYSRMTDGGFLGPEGMTGIEDVTNNTVGMRIGFSVLTK